jgi:hypothetical protein
MATHDNEYNTVLLVNIVAIIAATGAVHVCLRAMLAKFSLVNMMMFRSSLFCLIVCLLNLIGIHFGYIDGIILMKVFVVIGAFGPYLQILLCIYRFSAIFTNLLPDWSRPYLKF